jgi:hypothetical protein
MKTIEKWARSLVKYDGFGNAYPVRLDLGTFRKLVAYVDQDLKESTGFPWESGRFYLAIPFNMWRPVSIDRCRLLLGTHHGMMCEFSVDPSNVWTDGRSKGLRWPGLPIVRTWRIPYVSGGLSH